MQGISEVRESVDIAACQMLLNKVGSVSQCSIMQKCPGVRLMPNLRSPVMDSFSKVVQDLQIDLGSDAKLIEDKLAEQHPCGIEEDSQHDLECGPLWSHFLGSTLILDNPLS